MGKLMEGSSESVAVSCESVSLQVKKKYILDRVTFDVPKGSITGLLGPNGAGKSSLMRMIAGLTQPDSGMIRLFGQPAGVEMLGDLSLLPDRGSSHLWVNRNDLVQRLEKVARYSLCAYDAKPFYFVGCVIRFGPFPFCSQWRSDRFFPSVIRRP